MAYEDVLKATVVDAAFSEHDKAVILGVVQEAYEKSSIARDMFDTWVATGRTIRYDYGEGRFDAWDGVVTLDLKQLTDASYVDGHGKAVQDYPFTAIIHELGHALTGRGDEWSVIDPAGPNQDFVNEIYKQAGYTTQLAYMAYDAHGAVIQRGLDYTDGHAIDNAWAKKWSFLPNDFDVDKDAANTDARRDLIIGSAENNALKSGAGDDYVYGLGGNDKLYGGTGSDHLAGGEGRDLLDGGDGFDYASYVHAAKGVVASLANPGMNAGEAAGDHYLSIEGLVGSQFDDRLVGDGHANTIEGRGGNDALIGFGGADTLIGGTGNDTYWVDDAFDTIVEATGEGADRVMSGIAWTLGDNVEDLQLTGKGNVSGTGNALDNLIGGNDGDNVLDGRGGADVMRGGKGNDTYIVDNVGDRVGEAAGHGLDTVRASVSFTLSDHVENLNLTGQLAIDGTGNKLDNVIVGNQSANVLKGMGGNDTLYGGLGNDTLIGGSGSDKFVFNTVPYPTNVDTIADFEHGVDKIALAQNYFFEDLQKGAADLVTAVSGAITSFNDKLFYDNNTGNLSYDWDGTGTEGSAILIAHLTPHATLTAGDILIV